MDIKHPIYESLFLRSSELYTYKFKSSVGVCQKVSSTCLVFSMRVVVTHSQSQRDIGVIVNYNS